MRSVLLVQSHVVHGYVGGRAATFPLQYLGWNVDNINTVNFSNHTGYGHVQGSSLLDAELQSLFIGLRNISCRYDAIILGYIPSSRLIDVLADNVASMKKNNNALLYICDPVMGDQGHLYVDDSCVKAYIRLLSLGLVDLITPNQFELELLCGFAIDSADKLRKALSSIHSKFNVKHIVVSSLSGSLSLFGDKSPDSIYCAVSTHSTKEVEVFRIPEIKSYFTGVGDLFTALLLDKFSHNLHNLPLAVGQVLGIMNRVLQFTHTSGLKEFCKHRDLEYDPNSADNDKLIQGTINDGKTMRFFELRVIESRKFYDLTEMANFERTSI